MDLTLSISDRHRNDYDEKGPLEGAIGCAVLFAGNSMIENRISGLLFRLRPTAGIL
jgi:hypothetical protein